MYGNILMYGYYDNNSVLIIRVSTSYDIFLIVCIGFRIDGTGYSGWLLIYTYRVKKYAISKRLFTGHINIPAFISFKVLNIGSLIYM